MATSAAVSRAADVAAAWTSFQLRAGHPMLNSRVSTSLARA